jgi:hypothetical protein
VLVEGSVHVIRTWWNGGYQLTIPPYLHVIDPLAVHPDRWERDVVLRGQSEVGARVVSDEFKTSVRPLHVDSFHDRRVTRQPLRYAQARRGTHSGSSRPRTAAATDHRRSATLWRRHNRCRSHQKWSSHRSSATPSPPLGAPAALGRLVCIAARETDKTGQPTGLGRLPRTLVTIRSSLAWKSGSEVVCRTLWPCSPAAAGKPRTPQAMGSRLAGAASATRPEPPVW